MATQELILAVDGGGSKTDVALLTARGRVLGAARGAGMPYREIGVPAAIDRLAATVAACADSRPRRREGVAGIGVYCLPGADLGENKRDLTAALEARGWTNTSLVLNDTFAALRAGTERSWGVVVVCGTGINCLGIDRAGRAVRFDALGWPSGDVGGAFALGRDAVVAAVRARDGRGPGTLLEQLVPAQFGLRRPADVTSAIRSGRLGVSRVMELPPVVFAAARDGDDVARTLLDHLADELTATALAAVRRLRFVRSDVDVVLAGGLTSSGDAAFVGRIRSGITAVARRARVSVLTVPPVVGAALLGLDLFGVEDAAGRVRAALTEQRFRSG
jgi:N-acetylglucosamine kinase-like BadF-type ATPase